MIFVLQNVPFKAQFNDILQQFVDFVKATPTKVVIVYFSKTLQRFLPSQCG